MQTIYCFVEEQSEELNEFINLHDSDSVIHIYSSIVESCEGSLYFCLGELVNEYIHTEGKIWLVTDVKSLFDIAKKLCASLFEQIIYIEEQTGNNFDEKFSRTKKDFSEGLETAELIEYEIMVQPSKLNASFMKRLAELKNSDDMQSMVVFLYDLTDLNIKNDEKKSALWCHFCEILLYEIDYNCTNNRYNYKDLDSKYFLYKLTLYSILMAFSGNSVHANKYLQLIINGNATNGNMYFVWNQFKRISLKSLAVLDEETHSLLDKLYEKSYNGYKKELCDKAVRLKKERRNKDRVLVSAIQFLDNTHAPTRTVIERCKALSKLGKEVLLVNTTEQYLMSEYMPLYNAGYGRVLKEYNEIDNFKFGDVNISFIQLPSELSITLRFKALEKIINQFNPYYILSIGTGSMLADLCGNIISCACMSLAFSTLPHTMNKMRILGRKLSEEEVRRYSEIDIIESRFTFELRPQTRKFTRAEMQLPEDRFILVVVGIRLQFEIMPDFMEMLTSVCKKGCYVVFAGKFENYDELMKQYDIVSCNSSFIGYCDEILALMEICDLYINPARLGGGFSVIEAFEKGKPGVYLRTGDVYTAGGEDFAVEDYAEMVDEILKYKNDRKYYEEKSILARERAKLMTSSMEAIADIDKQICERVEKEQ